MSIGREDYQERKENRIERLEARAAAAAQESHNAFRRSDAMISAIPRDSPFCATIPVPRATAVSLTGLTTS